jgi:hypothetical protein
MFAQQLYFVEFFIYEMYKAMQTTQHQSYFDGEGVLCFVKLLALFLKK